MEGIFGLIVVFEVNGNIVKPKAIAEGWIMNGRKRVETVMAIHDGIFEEPLGQPAYRARNDRIARKRPPPHQESIFDFCLTVNGALSTKRLVKKHALCVLCCQDAILHGTLMV